MSPEAAAAAVQEEVKNRVEQTKRQVDAKMMQGANELRNAALTVLANPSPSAPGSPPGERKPEKELEYVQFWRWRKWHIRNPIWNALLGIPGTWNKQNGSPSLC